MNGCTVARVRTLPRAAQAWQPVDVLAKRDHEESQRQPVAVTDARLERRIQPVIEVPPHVFQAPLVRPHLPAPVEASRDAGRSGEMVRDGRAPRTGQASNEEAAGLTDGFAGGGRSCH